ncbi:MAG: GH25 family lysozyme [Clostridia bacterium]|nr:GH25 family lysozyme [Clostridia bacterium]
MKKVLSAILAIIICFSSIVTASAVTGGSWKQNSKGWWYEYADGSYQKGWAAINGNKYYFDKNNGYAATGWKEIGGKWYLFGSKSCAMLTGWQKVGNNWYYLHKNGEMLIRWQKTDIGWCYFTSKGKWVKDTAYESNHIFGIDVSKWQGKIDWQSVKNFGVKFAFVRMGYGSQSTGARLIDPYFDANMKAAEKAGIPVGVYYYSTATNETEALLDAQFVIDNIGGYLVSYPVAIDIEDAVQANLSKDTLGNMAKVFGDEIKSAGYTPMLYCNENWYKNKIDTTRIPNMYKWVARYNAIYDTNVKRDIWQSASSCKVDGISGVVDVNFGFTDFTKIVTPRRKKSASYQRKNGAWRQNSKGWWYEYTSGGWAVGWELIGKYWYYFDKNGYMCTGWINDGKAWYWLEDSGAWSGHKKDDITDPSVHTPLTSVASKTPTCTSEGIIAHYKCDVCGRLFSDAQGKSQISLSDIVIPKTEHTLIHIKKTEPTYTTEGVLAHDKCTECNKMFIDGNEVNSVIIPVVSNYKQGWKKNNKGWWYQYSDGTYPYNKWDKIDNKWYYFDLKGYMVTGWIKTCGVWYYTDKSGAMLTDWQLIGGKWYYFNKSGAMQTGWISLKGKWYYLNGSGAMVTGTVKIGAKTYKFNSSGVWIG